MADLAVTAVGADRPGIVATVAEVLQERGGNVEDSAMTILGGRFAIVLIVSTDDDPDQLRAALESATGELGLVVSVSRTGTTRRPDEPTHLLSVYGADRPGIVAGVTRTLAELGANITDLETQVVGRDEPVYAMVIEVVAVDGGLDDRLSAVCEQLGVDHTLRTIEAQTY
ncbi:glycine cleavage system protein R [Egicoccus halophilus]|uniref:Amino acid-binding protein n=1 Tax=Egicoccus halophilus TaxID=1670830 RepID=A0A8J3AC65_9ACTN|nr:ACT domain-containing protein [Egicoccus halophilus]GGI03319.1 amino acid-binding protein [Egicoccus halophilus]